MLDQALPFRAVQAKSHDEFRRRADECRRLAAAARNARDRAFWLGLVERWQALEGRLSLSVRRPDSPLSAGKPWEEDKRTPAARRQGSIVSGAPTPVDVLVERIAGHKSVSPGCRRRKAAGARSSSGKRRNRSELLVN